MKFGAENKTKLWTLIGLGSIAVIFFVYQFVSNFGGGSSTSAPPPVAVQQPSMVNSTRVSSQPTQTAPQNSAKAVASSGAQLDPTLHMETMHTAETLEYTGNGRNIFSMSSVPVASVNIPKPIASARPTTILSSATPVPTGPPPPPPINLKFFGISTVADGTRQAFFLQGDDVFIAKDGDIIARRYKVNRVNATSSVVEDLQTHNTQTLPLVMQ